MLRRIVGWVVLVPLSVVLIVFALANRQLTVVNFNPLVSPGSLASPGVGVPLFLVIFCFLLLGVVLGGIATWFASGQLRREKRQWQKEAARLGRELDGARRASPPAGRRISPLDIDDLVDTP
jgi:uncharacterized integral membrane protein